MKEIFFEIIAELEDLRASLVVLADAIPHPPTMSNARDAKSVAIAKNKKSYDQLRKKIAALDKQSPSLLAPV